MKLRSTFLCFYSNLKSTEGGISLKARNWANKLSIPIHSPWIQLFKYVSSLIIVLFFVLFIGSRSMARTVPKGLCLGQIWVWDQKSYKVEGLGGM